MCGMRACRPLWRSAEPRTQGYGSHGLQGQRAAADNKQQASRRAPGDGRTVEVGDSAQSRTEPAPQPAGRPNDVLIARVNAAQKRPGWGRKPLAFAAQPSGAQRPFASQFVTRPPDKAPNQHQPPRAPAKWRHQRLRGHLGIVPRQRHVRRERALCRHSSVRSDCAVAQQKSAMPAAFSSSLRACA